MNIRQTSMMLLSSLSLVLPGCTLLFDASEHQGGSEMEDASTSRDAGPARDAGSTVDAGRDDAGRDDAGPPAECTTASECAAAGLVECVANRCRFCASTATDPQVLRRGSGIQPKVYIEIATRSTAPPLGYVSTLGADFGTPSTLHEFELGTLTSVTAHSLDDPFDYCSTYDRFTSTALMATSPGSAGLSIQLLAAGATGGVLTYYRLDGGGGGLYPAGYTCRDRDPPADVLPTGGFVRDGGYPLGITRELSDSGNPILRETDADYANGTTTRSLPSGFSQSEMELVSAEDHVLVAGDERIAIWDGAGPFTGSTISTPSVSGPPSLGSLGGGRHLLAFPVGDRMRFSEVMCEGTSDCEAMGSSVDMATGAEEIVHARMLTAAGQPILVTGERMADGRHRVVLRVLRNTRQPFDAPNAASVHVLDTLDAGLALHDVELDVMDAAVVEYLIVWHREVPGEESEVRVQVVRGTCGS